MKPKLREIEILRGFAISTVLIYHVTGKLFLTKSTSYMFVVLEYLNCLFSFGVPLFIFLTGFISSLVYNHEKKDFSVLHYYKKRLLTILPPYIFTAILYIIFRTPDNPYTILSPSTISLHLWYIDIILQFYLFYPLIRLIIHECKSRLNAVLFVSITFQFSVVVINYFLNINQTFIDYIGYFILGMYVHENYDKIKKFIIDNKIIILFASVIFLSTILQSYIFHVILTNGIRDDESLFYHLYNKCLGTIFFVFFFLFFLSLAIIIEEERNSFRGIMTNIGKYSYGIYLYQFLFLDPLYDLFILIGINKNYLIFYIFLFFATTSMSMLLTYLISIFPYSHFIVGKIRSYKTEDATITLDNTLFKFESFINN